MHISVHKAQRKAKMRAHTATHLLHGLLSHILWDTRQAWSYVDQDILRFDFATKKPLSTEQITQINTAINLWIQASSEVSIQEMSLEDAKQTGAKMFFEDKYGETVRVVHVEALKNDIYTTDINSVELCGGTHVSNTSEIWAFLITEQSAVASGIRRITAVTGPKVAQTALDQQSRIEKLSTRLDCQPKQLEDKLEKIMNDFEHIKQDHESMQTQIIQNHLIEAQKSATSRETIPTVIYIWQDSHLAHHDYKTTVQTAKQIRSDQDRLIYTDAWAFALYTWASNTAKSLATTWGLKWWGSDQFVQGKDENVKQL